MPITTLAANAEGAHTDFSNVGGPDKVASVALPDDDNTSYVSEVTSNDRQSFTFEDLPGAAAFVDTYSLITRAAVTSSGPDMDVQVTGGAGYGPASTRTPGTGYTTYTDVDLQESGPASMLTIAKINALEGRITKVGGGGNALRVTTFYATATWRPTPGMITFLVSEWLLPLVGLGTMTFREIANQLWYEKTRPFYREEFETIRSELKRLERGFLYVGASG